MRGGAEVLLRIEGEEKRYRATAIENDPPHAREWLQYYLVRFPQDAAYHSIRLNPDKSLVTEDLREASRHAIVIEATPL